MLSKVSESESNSIHVKRCEWCREPLETFDKRVKYHIVNSKGVKCKEEARKDKTRLRKHKYDKKHPEVSRKQNIEKLGTFDLPPYKLEDALTTTYLGRLILFDPWGKEYEEIHKLHEKVCVTSYIKGKKQSKNTQYKGVSLLDYDNFNITFLLENPGPCPICGDKLQEKDITRCELICRNTDCEGHGGLVLRGTQFNIAYPEGEAKMGYTAQDISQSQLAKQFDKDVTTQDIAWNNFFNGK